MPIAVSGGAAAVRVEMARLLSDCERPCLLREPLPPAFSVAGGVEDLLTISGNCLTRFCYLFGCLGGRVLSRFFFFFFR